MQRCSWGYCMEEDEVEGKNDPDKRSLGRNEFVCFFKFRSMFPLLTKNACI